MEVIMEPRNHQETLLKRARQGESGAFEALVAECRTELEKYVASRIGDHLRPIVDAEDVIQETLTRAWDSIRRLHWTGTATFVRWLKGIARHVILQQIDRHEHSELLYLDEFPASGDPSPSRAARREERFDRLQAAVNRLPPDYREAILLVRIEGHSVKEAARRMERTPKAVMHLLSRGLEKLKGIMADTESFGLPPKHLEEEDRHER